MLDRIPPDRAVSIEREVFPQLIGEGLYGIRLEGYWIDIGTPERFLEANWDILERRVETVIGDQLDGADDGGGGLRDLALAPSSEPPASVGARFGGRVRTR